MVSTPYLNGMPAYSPEGLPYNRLQYGPSVFNRSINSYSFYARDSITGSTSLVQAHGGRVTVTVGAGKIDHNVKSLMSFGDSTVKLPKYKTAPSNYTLNGKYLVSTSHKRVPNVNRQLEFRTGRTGSRAFRNTFKSTVVQRGKYRTSINAKLSKAWMGQRIGYGNRHISYTTTLGKRGLSKQIPFKTTRTGSNAFKSLFAKVRANTGQIAFKLSKSAAKNFRNVLAFGGQAMGDFVGRGKIGSRSAWQSYFNSIAKNSSYNKLSAQTKMSRGISSTVRVRGVNVPAEYRVTGLAGSYEKSIPGKDLTKPGKYQTMAYVNQRFINFEAINKDGVTPRLVELQIFMNSIQTEQFAKALRESIPASIKRLYKNKNYGHWAKNSPQWLRKKRSAGLDTRIMHMKNFITIDGKNGYLVNIPLAQAVNAAGNYINVKVVGEGTVVVEGIDDAFKDNPYVWFHETGYHSTFGTEVPARPFIVPGINEGSAQAVRWLAMRTPHRSPGVPTMRYKAGDMLGYSKGIEDSVRRMSRIIWWFMPPSEYWKFLGYYADIRGILKGYFLNTDSIMRFAWAFARGKASGVTGIPFTEKFARRRFRYRLYTNTGRLPHG